MTADEWRAEIDSLVSHILFSYHGKDCGVDPINRQHIDVWCGKDAITAKSVDEAMTYPLFEGKGLAEIVDEITDIEW